MAIKALTVTLSLLALSAPAIGARPGVDAGSGDVQIGITGYVPVICRTSVEGGQFDVRDGRVSLGSMQEFCNNPRGYAVIADFSANLADGALVVGGRRVPLDASGSVEIVKSNRAAITSRPIELELPEDTQSGSISFRIQPL